MELFNCPFCDGVGDIQKGLRDGYQDYQDDPDAYAYWVTCRGCACTGPWAKSEASARRLWNMRMVKAEQPCATVLAIPQADRDKGILEANYSAIGVAVPGWEHLETMSAVVIECRKEDNGND